jgi:predicted DNA-binding ribbon-helix-helix protein
MAGPIKRSVMIAGHATSVSLEPVFWEALKRASAEEAVPISALVARIDAARVGEDDPSNLASAIRVWLMARAIGAGSGPQETMDDA